MKKDSGKKGPGEEGRLHPLKALARAAALAGGLLVSAHLGARPADAAPKERSIKDRVGAVRAALKEKLADGADSASKLSYSETELAQWGNWGNWGNWNNWNNWRNWANWANWGNWGNWRNY
ncbi:MAG TPA: hypothetical protein VNZ44_09965 [Pyrinomonadaceae bacterium]|nr:hypothetical protein [Pyrinomonadaceae bacterium]